MSQNNFQKYDDPNRDNVKEPEKLAELRKLPATNKGKWWGIFFLSVLIILVLFSNDNTKVNNTASASLTAPQKYDTGALNISWDESHYFLDQPTKDEVTHAITVAHDEYSGPDSVTVVVNHADDPQLSYFKSGGEYIFVWVKVSPDGHIVYIEPAISSGYVPNDANDLPLTNDCIIDMIIENFPGSDVK